MLFIQKMLETWLNSGTVVCRNITIKHKPTIYWIANFRFSNISPLTEEPNSASLPQEDIQQATNETRCRFLIEKCSSLEREINTKKKRIAKLSSLHVNEKKVSVSLCGGEDKLLVPSKVILFGHSINLFGLLKCISVLISSRIN